MIDIEKDSRYEANEKTDTLFKVSWIFLEV